MPDDDAKLLKWYSTTAESLRRARLPHESVWRDIRDNFEPSLGRALNDDPDVNAAAATLGDDRIINERPRDLISRLAAGLQSGITNQARQWFRFIASDTTAVERSRTAREWLDKATEELQDVFAQSNVYTALISMYMRLGQFGTSCALLLPDPETTLHLEVIDEGAYWIAENRRARVDTLLRRLDCTAAQIADEYSEDNLPRLVRDAIQQGDIARPCRVWNLIVPRSRIPREVIGNRIPESVPFVSLHVWDGSASGAQLSVSGERRILDVRAFQYNPIIAPRWETPSGSAYGCGPGHKGLAGAKELQALEQDKLEVAEQVVHPSLAAPDTMRDEDILIAPNSVTYYPLAAISSGGRVPIQRLLETEPSVQPLLEAISAQEQRLDRIFYADLFAMLLQIQLGAGKRQMTATEVSELASEKVSLLGPILTRLNTDLLDPLVEGSFALLLERAQDDEADAVIGGANPRLTWLLEPPDSIAGDNIRIQYRSTLHIEQMAASRLLGFTRMYEFAGQVANFDQAALDWIDNDKVMREAVTAYMEFGAIRDEKEVETIREDRAAQAEAQMQQQQMLADTQAAQGQAALIKDLTQAQAAAGGDILSPAQPPVPTT